MGTDHIKKMDSKFLNRQLDVFYLFVNEFGYEYLTRTGKTYFSLLKGERATRIDSEVKPIILWLRAIPQEGRIISNEPFAILLARETDDAWYGVSVNERGSSLTSWYKSLYALWT